MIGHKVILARVGQGQQHRDHKGGFYNNINRHNYNAVL